MSIGKVWTIVFANFEDEKLDTLAKAKEQIFNFCIPNRFKGFSPVKAKPVMLCVNPKISISIGELAYMSVICVIADEILNVNLPVTVDNTIVIVIPLSENFADISVISVLPV